MQSGLLIVDIASLSADQGGKLVLGLPSRDIPKEHLLDLLECFSGRLREHEEDVDSHGGTEDTEDDVHLPLDVDKGRRNEVRLDQR